MGLMICKACGEEVEVFSIVPDICWSCYAEGDEWGIEEEQP